VTNALRSVLGLTLISALVLAQAGVRTSRGCSMCGAVCHCASRMAGGSCSIRSVGCGGGDAAAAAPAPTTLAALPAAPGAVTTLIDLSALVEARALRVEDPDVSPPEHPPRVSC
jgi:hypothetical protein